MHMAIRLQNAPVRSIKAIALIALAVSAAGQVASGQTNGTWIGTAGSTWSLSTNWLGASIPDAGGTAFINDFTGQTAGHALSVDSARTLGEINWNSGYSMSIATAAGQSITMGSSGLTLNSQRSFTNSPVSTFISNSVTGQIIGSGNLVKTGPGVANISNITNSFTGSVNINDGLLWNNTGNDAVYGNAANAINLNGGVMGVATTALTTSRVINVNSASTLRAAAAPTMSTFDQLRGSAALAKDGAGLWTIGAANLNFTGDLRIDQGSLTLSGTGQIGGTGVVDLPGTVNLSSTATAVNNRLSGRNVVTRGGDLILFGNASTAVLETLGNLNITQGQTFISARPSSVTGASTDFRFSTFNRLNNATVFINGTSLGLASGTGVGNVYVTNAPTVVGGGGDPTTSFNSSIIPYVWGNIGTSTIGSTFLTWDSTSQRLIPVSTATGYNTNINSAGATDNVNLIAAAENVTSAVTVNALRFGLASGTAQTISGSQITVTSGAILNSSPQATAPTVTVTAPITSGSAEMVIYATVGTLQLNNTLSGTGGLTRNGSGALSMNSATNDYSGTTTFNGGTTIVTGGTVDIASANAPSVFGTSGDIVFNGSGGIVRVWTNSNLVINRDVVARLGHSSALGIGTQGASTSESVTINGNVNLIQTTTGFFTNFLQLEGGDTRPEALTINGVVSGGGGLRGQFGSYTILNSTNSYSGGTIVGSTGFATGTGATRGTQGENWEIGANGALGTGTIWVQNFLSGTSNVPAPGTMLAGGAARTISNPIVTVSGYARVDGSNPLTWAGSVNLNGSAQGATSIDVGANSPLTISGVVSSGGLVKNGPGTLTLTNTNTYSARTVVTNGVLSVASIGNGGTPGNLGQAPATASYIVLGGSSAATTGTLRYTGSGETTNRLFQLSGYGGTLDASGSGPLVFGNTGSLTIQGVFGSIGSLAVIAATSVITVGNINAENIPVGTVITNALFPAGTTITESNINFMRLSNVPSAGGTGQTIAFTTLPSDYRRTLNLSGTNAGLNTLAPIVGEFSTTIPTRIAKSGTGTWNLTAANTYTGGTTVNAGRLLINNTSGSGTGTGNVIVNGGILGGDGSISGNVTVNANGVLAPGNSPGDINIGGNLTLGASSIFDVELNGMTAGTGYDQAIVGGTVTLDAASLLSVSLGFTPAIGDAFWIINQTPGTSPVSGTFNTLPDQTQFTVSGTLFEIRYATDFSLLNPAAGSGNDVALVVVPEPTVLGLLAAASVMVLRRKRR